MSPDVELQFEAGLGWTQRSRTEPERACRILFRLIRIAVARTSHDLQMPRARKAVHPYTAPECLHTAPLDELTEVYAFGALLYNLLTGRLPFEADNDADLSLRILKSNPDPITTYAPELPAGLSGVVQRALCRDRRERIATLAELARELEPYAGMRFSLPVDLPVAPSLGTPALRTLSDSWAETRVLPRASFMPAAPLDDAPRTTRALHRTSRPSVPLALRATMPAPPRPVAQHSTRPSWLLGVAMVLVASLFGVGVYHVLPAPSATSPDTSWFAQASVRVRAADPMQVRDASAAREARTQAASRR